jgi:tRNA1Val (adenine37-N6)-methyltransferase
MKVSTDSCLFGAWAAEQCAGVEGHVLDIGAGTGLLSLMMAQSTYALIDAVELEDCCYSQLKENIASSNWKYRVTAVHADILSYSSEKSYNLIVSNPPFYENQLQSPDTTVNLARHAKELNISALFQKVKELIVKDGEFYVLIPYYRLNECLKIAESCGFFIKHHVEVKHSNQHRPFRAMLGFKIVTVESRYEALDIKGPDGQYNHRFKELLSPFYLNL